MLVPSRFPRLCAIGFLSCALFVFGCEDAPGGTGGMGGTGGAGGMGGTGGTGGTGGMQAPCPLYQARCGGVCIPTTADPNNCGGCGVTCSGGQVCSGGSCRASCLTGLSPCAGACVDLGTEDAHCGSCGHPCDADKGCVAGTCQPRVPTSGTGGSCDPVQVARPGGGSSQTCTGDLAQTTFRWALCSCTDLTLSGSLLTDGYDGTTGAYQPGSLGGGVGLNGQYSTSSSTTVWGALWASDAGGLSTSGAATIKQELHVGGPLTSSSPIAVSEDGYVAGNLTTSGSITFAKTLFTPASSTLAGNITAASLVRQPVTVVPPCDCQPSQLVPVADIVAAHQMTNDNASIGHDAHAFESPGGPRRLDLPCGRYYLTQIQTAAPIAIVAHGRTALFIDGDISSSAAITITLGPTAELDLFVKGTIASAAPLTLGSPNHPALMRTYLGGSQLALSGNLTVGGFLYAAATDVTLSSAQDLYGGLFAKKVSSSGPTAIHYDRAVLRAGESCRPPSPTPPSPGSCTSCRDCGNQACIGGTCGACVTHGDCCAPLVCDGGRCVPFSIR